MAAGKRTPKNIQLLIKKLATEDAPNKEIKQKVYEKFGKTIGSRTISKYSGRSHGGALSMTPEQTDTYLRKYGLKLTGNEEKRRARVHRHIYNQTPKGVVALENRNEVKKLNRAAKGSLVSVGESKFSPVDTLANYKAREYAYRATGSPDSYKTNPAYKALGKNWVNSLTPAQRVDAVAPIEMRDMFNKALRTAKGEIDKNYQRNVHHTQPFKYGGVQPINSGYAQIIPAQQHRAIHADPNIQKLWESNQDRGVRVGGVMPENPYLRNVRGLLPENTTAFQNFFPEKLNPPPVSEGGGDYKVKRSAPSGGGGAIQKPVTSMMGSSLIGVKGRKTISEILRDLLM